MYFYQQYSFVRNFENYKAAVCRQYGYHWKSIGEKRLKIIFKISQKLKSSIIFPFPPFFLRNTASSSYSLPLNTIRNIKELNSFIEQVSLLQKQKGWVSVPFRTTSIYIKLLILWRKENEGDYFCFGRLRISCGNFPLLHWIIGKLKGLHIFIEFIEFS